MQIFRNAKVSSGAFLIFVWVITFALSGCGGSGDDSSTAIARLQVEPSAVLMETAGEVRTLTVRAFNAKGKELSAPQQVTITSSNPNRIKVLPGGQVQAVSAGGSAVITVSTGTATAAPVTVVVAQLQPGVMTIDDANVVSQPVLIGDPAEAGIGSQFRVTLRNATSLTPGSLVIASGASRLAGKVVSVVPEGNDSRVVLEAVHLTQLVKNLDVDIELPIEPIDLEIDASTEETSSPQDERAHPQAVADPNPLDCDRRTRLQVLKLTGRLTPVFKLQKTLSIADGKVEELMLAAVGDTRGELKAVFNLGGSGVLVNFSCKLKLGSFPVPLDGPLSAFIAPSIPLGLEASIKFEFVPSALNLTVRIRPEVKSVTGFSYKPSTGVVPVASFTPKFDITGDASTLFTLRLGTKVSAGVVSGLSASFGGGKAEFNLVDVSDGPELDMNYAFVRDTMTDSTYDASYKARANLAVKPANDVLKLLGFLQNISGVDIGIGATANLTTELARSPKGASAVLAEDKTSFARGELVQFRVKLTDEEFLTFYNVAEIRVYRMRGELSAAELVVAKKAEEPHTSFSLNWVADRDSSSEDRYYAYVVPVLFETVGSLFPFPLKEFVLTGDSYRGEFGFTTNDGLIGEGIVQFERWAGYHDVGYDGGPNNPGHPNAKAYLARSGSLKLRYGTTDCGSFLFNIPEPSESGGNASLSFFVLLEALPPPELRITAQDGLVDIPGGCGPFLRAPIAGGIQYGVHFGQPYVRSTVAPDLTFFSSQGTLSGIDWQWRMVKQ